MSQHFEMTKRHRKHQLCVYRWEFMLTHLKEFRRLVRDVAHARNEKTETEVNHGNTLFGIDFGASEILPMTSPGCRSCMNETDEMAENKVFGIGFEYVQSIFVAFLRSAEWRVRMGKILRNISATVSETTKNRKPPDFTCTYLHSDPELHFMQVMLKHLPV